MTNDTFWKNFWGRVYPIPVNPVKAHENKGNNTLLDMTFERVIRSLMLKNSLTRKDLISLDTPARTVDRAMYGGHVKTSTKLKLLNAAKASEDVIDWFIYKDLPGVYIRKMKEPLWAIPSAANFPPK